MQVSNTIYYHQLGLAKRWTAHDLGRTALTGMAKLGVAPIVLGHVANHRTTTKAGITLGVYVHHAYEREKRLKLVEAQPPKLIEATSTNGEKADARLPPPIPDRRFRRI
jgi:hypothetical protein